MKDVINISKKSQVFRKKDTQDTHFSEEWQREPAVSLHSGKGSVVWCASDCEN